MIRTMIGSIGVCAILVSCVSGDGTEAAAPEEPKQLPQQ
jgi:hypothetical protein